MIKEVKWRIPNYLTFEVSFMLVILVLMQWITFMSKQLCNWNTVRKIIDKLKRFFDQQNGIDPQKYQSTFDTIGNYQYALHSFRETKSTLWRRFQDHKWNIFQKNRESDVKSDTKTAWFEQCHEKTNVCCSTSYECQRYSHYELVHFRRLQYRHRSHISINHGHGLLWLYYSNHCSDWIDIKHFWDLFSFNWNQTRKNKQFTATQFRDF